MKFWSRSLLLAAALLCFASPASAEVPFSLTHQGRLLDDAGAPVTGTVDLNFSLYDAASGGATLWSEQVSADLGTDGFFSVSLGGGTNEVDPTVLDNAEVWLGLSVNGGAELSPRLRVLSVPFAVTAGRALGVAPGSITTESVADGAITSTQLSTVPWQKLTNVPTGVADGDDDTLAGLMCGSGEIAEWNGSAWACGSRYTDAQAVAAVGAHYTDADAIAAVGPHYTDAQAVAAMGSKANGNALNHDRYTNANAVAAMGAKADGNPLNHDKTSYSAGAGISISGTQIAANPRGVVYTRWGRSVCSSGAQRVYQGYAASGAHDHGGGISSLHCLTNAPAWPVSGLSDGNENGALLYGTEFQTSGYGISSLVSRHDRDANCAVCMQPAADMQIMIPGTNVCPSGWNAEYNGYLMGTHYTQASTHEAACVDVNPESVGSAADNNGNLWYPTETECGSLPCAPYVQNREVTCVVCSR